MQIEIGKFYRTRDGHIAGPATVSDRFDWPYSLPTSDDNGDAYFKVDGTCPYLPEYNLIEECENPKLYLIAATIMRKRDNGGCEVKDWEKEAESNCHVAQALRQARAVLEVLRCEEPCF